MHQNDWRLMATPKQSYFPSSWLSHVFNFFVDTRFMTWISSMIPNYHQNQAGDVPAFCLEALPQTSTSQSYENQVRKYEACTPLFAPNECKSKGKRDDDSDGDQVRQLQEQLSQKDNDMASIMAQMKVITASLAEKANPWSDTSTLQIYNQKDPYSSTVSSSSNKEFNWQ